MRVFAAAKKTAKPYGGTGRKPLTVAQRLRKRLRDRLRYQRDKYKIRRQRKLYRKKHRLFHTERKHQGRKEPSYLKKLKFHVKSSPPPPKHHESRFRTQGKRHSYMIRKPKAYITPKKHH
jgi:hypothetical protein